MRLQLVTILVLGAKLFAAVLFADAYGGEFSYVDAVWSYEHPEVPDDLDNEYRVCVTRVKRAAFSPLSHGSAEDTARFVLKGFRECYREIVLGLP